MGREWLPLQGLKEEDIPVEGRITNIADQYDALRAGDHTSLPLTMIQHVR